jgi:hypothetical protein
MSPLENINQNSGNVFKDNSPQEFDVESQESKLQ